MNLPIIIRPRAARDIVEQQLFIQADNLQAAERYIDAVEETVGRLAEYPDLGRLVEVSAPRLAGMRQIPVRGFRNYLIFYRTDRRRVVIERVLHAAQDIPGVFAVQDE